MYQIHGREFITDKGSIWFPLDIDEVVEINGVIVLCLTFLGKPGDSNQVYGVKDGEVIWRVAPQRSRYDYAQEDPYAGIYPYDINPSLLIGVTTRGDRFVIDPTNGKIVGKESWVK